MITLPKQAPERLLNNRSRSTTFRPAGARRRPVELGSLFPRAMMLDELLQGLPARVCEPRRRRTLFPGSERHLHCVWFDPVWRPEPLVDTRGDTVRVVYPGQWNLESGPDFLRAELEVGRERRRIHGDVEIHVRPADWRAHGHGGDPNFRDVIAHVCFTSGVLAADELPPGCLQLSLEAPLAARPAFGFDAIDITAYPYEVEGPLHPLRDTMRSWSRDQKEAFLRACGEARLLAKSERIQAAAERADPEQALYEETMGALGYKQNREPFRALARALPVAELRERARANPEVAYALLLGMSGLMPESPEQYPDRETASLIRRAWDIWWKEAGRFEGRGMARGDWHLAHVRPSNHPRRRLMAAAYLFTEDVPFGEKLSELSGDAEGKAASPRAWLKNARHLLEVNTQTYWTRRLSLGGGTEALPMALIGGTRAKAVIINVLVPFLAATGSRPDLFRDGLVDVLPSEGMNQILRETAHALFGPDHSPALYRGGLKRQGLIHVFYAYALGGAR